MRIQVLDPQWKKMDPDPRSQYVADQTDKDPKQCLGVSKNVSLRQIIPETPNLVEI